MKKIIKKQQADPQQGQMFRRIFRILLFFLIFDGFLLRASADPSNISLSFNEIMYDPPSHDNNKEFIELVADANINLSNYTIEFNDQRDPLKLLQGFPHSFPAENHSTFYILLVEDGFNLSTLPPFNGSIYGIGERAGKNLDNTQDTLILSNSAGDVVVRTAYQASPDSLASGQGSSISWFNGDWQETIPTPGGDNDFPVEPNDFNNTQPANINGSNLTEPEPCIPPLFSITTPQDIYTNKERIVFSFHLNTSNEQEQKDFNEDFSITYHVEDLDGELVRSPTTTSNTKPKSFTPAIKIPQQALLIRAVLTTPCGQQEASQLLAVRNGPSSNPSSAKEDLRESADSSARKDSRRVSGKEGTTSLTNSERKFAVTILELERTFSPGSLYTTKILIDNENKPHHLTIWSYVYRGSKSYSGEREQNQQEFDLPAGESRIVELENILDDAMKPGAYKLKIKLRKDNQESTLDVTRDVVVEAIDYEIENASLSSVSKTEVVAGLMQVLDNASQISNNLTFAPATEASSSPVYQSSSAKIRSSLIYFLIGLLMMVILVFVWKL